MNILERLALITAVTSLLAHIQLQVSATDAIDPLFSAQQCSTSPLVKAPDACVADWTTSFTTHECIGGFCQYSDSGFAGSKGIAFLTTPEIGATLKTLRRVPPPTGFILDGGDIFDQREIPGKGIGLVAKRTLSRGELVIRELPVLVVHLDAGLAMPESTRLEMQRAAVDALPLRTKQTVWDLMGHLGGDPIEDRLETNAFGVAIGGQSVNHRALLTQTSRMNHDCRPSCILQFDSSTLVASVYTVQDVRPGDELTISYIPLPAVYEDRQSATRNWGFSCSCTACMLSLEDRLLSDERVRQIQDYIGQLMTWSNGRRAGPAMAETLVQLCQEENLTYFQGDAYRLAAHSYSGVRQRYQALRMANQALVYGRSVWGEASEKARDMLDLMANPEKHWTWGLQSDMGVSNAEPMTGI
ncbi:hypothetical protein BDW67DRAFT_190101 [Aspergillus spinulosporus]